MSSDTPEAKNGGEIPASTWSDAQKLCGCIVCGPLPKPCGRERIATALHARDQQAAKLQEQIDTGRCCDDFERLPRCGHPRCVVSEVCEICVEIGEELEQARKRERERCAKAVEALPLESDAAIFAAAIRALPEEE